MKRSVVALALGALSATSLSAPARGQAAFDPIADITDAITAIDIERAEKLLAPLDDKIPRISFELARLAMYRGDCETAERRLAPSEVQAVPDAGALLVVARDCMRAMSGTVTVTDELHGVVVRYQDDADQALTRSRASSARRSRNNALSSRANSASRCRSRRRSRSCAISSRSRR
jgi:hypothetical protein